MELILMVRCLIFSYLAFLLATGANAQTNKATLSLQLSFPQGEYKEKYPVTASGLLFGVVHQLKERSALSIGGELGIMQVSGDQDNYTGVYNNEYNTFHVASWNHIITLATLFRADLLNVDNSWNVYIDVSLGVNIFLTTATITRDLFYNPITNSNVAKYEYSDTHTGCSFRAGTGLGIEIPLGKNKKTALLFKGSYLYGSSVKYYGRPAIQNTQIILDPKKSKTSMILAETGIRFGIF
ncbi:MAG TPA: hypothetical protein VIZ28_06095 [Chitinophagaceae bacterium]